MILLRTDLFGGAGINDSIAFGANSPDINEDSTAILDGVALVLNNRREIKTVTVEGHTCNCPSWGMSNQELSEARAQAVRDYLDETRADFPECEEAYQRLFKA